ncbi:MAG TPA: hypothetical protein VJ653_07310, partial [Acidimicrobiales bacterium]|nr:hypothetical protein [Acidimicrobiales bacterium]
WVDEVLAEDAVDPENPTPAETMAAIAAAVALAGSSRPVRFSPGREYQTTGRFEVGDGAHVIAWGAHIRNVSGVGDNLITNIDKVGGNPGIIVEGGIWDYDSTTNPAASGDETHLHCIYFENCPDIKVVVEKVVNTLKFGILLAACDRYQVHAVFDTDSDGLHVYGPCVGGKGVARGKSGDDLVGLTIGDYPGFQTTVGDITDQELHLYPHDAASGLAIAGGVSSDGVALPGGPYVFRRIKVPTIMGTLASPGPCVRVLDDQFLEGTDVDGLEIGTIDVVDGFVTLGSADGAPVIKGVSIDRFVQGDPLRGIVVGEASVVEGLHVGHMRSHLDSDQPVISVAAGATLTGLQVDNVDAKFGANGRLLQSNGDVPDPHLGMVNVEGGLAVILQAAGAGDMRATIGSAKVKGTSAFLYTSGTITAVCGPLDLDVASTVTTLTADALVRLVAAAVDQASVGILNLTVGSEVSIFAPQLKCDATKLTPQLWDRVYNINAIAGGFVGQVQWNGSDWVNDAKSDVRPIGANTEEVYIARDVTGVRTFTVRGDGRGGVFAAGEAFRRVEWRSAGASGYGGLFFGRGNVDPDAVLGRTAGSIPGLAANCAIIPAVTAVATTGAPVTVDAGLGEVYRVNLGHDIGMGFGPGSSDGQRLQVELKQDATGGRVVTFVGTNVLWSGGAAPVVAPTAGHLTIVGLSWRDDLTKWVEAYRLADVG